MKETFKAWLSEKRLMEAAKPVVLSDEEQGWNFAQHIEDMDDVFLKMKWQSNVPGSGAPERVIFGAVQDMENMGYDVSKAERLLPEGIELLEKGDMIGLNRITWRIWNALNNAPKLLSHPYWTYRQYETFEQYLDDVEFPKATSYDINDPSYLEATHAGWIAQIIGGAVGTAVEGYTPEAIKKSFGTIRDYVRKPNTYNDDITYEIAFLQALQRKEDKLCSADIAEEWAALVPFGWSAEEWALKNIKMGIYPPDSGKLHNPYREWIGAQMRGVVCGMIVPGNYQEAARYAFMDGVVSHYNNGVLGEVFNALLAAGAYVVSDIRKLLRDVIDLIPRHSEYRSVIEYAYDSCLKNERWEDAWDSCRTRFERYNWIHAYPNAAAEVVSLWYGQGSFTDTISICCHLGYDVDCNAAQIGTVLGIQNGLASIEKHWKEPLGDRLDTYIRGHKQMSILEVAELTVSLARKLRNKEERR